MYVSRPLRLICKPWIIGDTKRSQPKSVRKPAVFRVPALITASALSYSCAPTRKDPCAAAIIAPAISPACFIASISSGDFHLFNAKFFWRVRQTRIQHECPAVLPCIFAAAYVLHPSHFRDPFAFHQGCDHNRIALRAHQKHGRAAKLDAKSPRIPQDRRWSYQM